MLLTAADCMYLLTLLQEKHGFGYSDVEIEVHLSDGPYKVKVGTLQAGLSIMMEAAVKAGKRGRG